MDKKKKMIAYFVLAFILLVILILFIIKSCSSVYYDVDFNTDGGSTVQSQKIKENETVTKPEDPTKEGYTFAYWQLDNKEYNFNKKVTKNIVLKAKWIENDPNGEKISVKFDSDGGTLISDLTISKNSKITKPNDPVKEGYIFKGWLVNGVLFDFDSEVNSDITLVASWEEETVSTTKKENNKKTTTKQNTQGSGSSSSNNHTQTTTTTRPNVTTTTTTKPISYSYKWVDVAGSTIGQSDLYIINKDNGNVVSGTATITYKNGASETISVSTSGKRFVKSAISSVSNVKGN